MEPNGHVALYQRGHCLILLARLDEAEAAFTDGAQRHPAHRDLYEQAIQQVHGLRA